MWPYIAKAAFQKMNSLVSNKSLSMNARKQMLNAISSLSLLYGCEYLNVNERLGDDRGVVSEMNETNSTDSQVTSKDCREMA